MAQPSLFRSEQCRNHSAFLAHSHINLPNRFASKGDCPLFSCRFLPSRRKPGSDCCCNSRLHSLTEFHPDDFGEGQTTRLGPARLRSHGPSCAGTVVTLIIDNRRSACNNEPKTCAHIPCRCVVPAGQTYCGQWCEEAGSEDVEIACECDHPPVCALTVTEETVA